jgi:hypothetical protein
MLRAILEVILYGIVAAFSPMAVAATVAVMRAGRARALVFGIVFVAAQFVSCLLFVVLGVAADGSDEPRYPWLQVAFATALAVALIWLARRVRRHPPAAHASPRTKAMLERLDRLSRVGLGTTVGVGIALGVGGPKRLLFAALAATAITTAGVQRSGEGLLVILYAAVATVPVWVPVILFGVLGDRAVVLIAQAQAGIRERQPQVTVNALLVLACLCLAEAASIVLGQVL